MRATCLHIAVVALAVVASAFAACSGGGDSTKAGGSGAPVTLRIGTADTPGRPGSDQIEEFARQVKELSGGKLRIEPVWDADKEGPDWDQEVARMVVRGELELGMIPTRAWDTEGVTSLRALSAPFLITNDEHLDRVVTGELADEMLAGVSDAGVVGLALVPEGMRHPFAFGKPLLGADDYPGRTVRAPTSSVTTALFAGLGATADDLGEGDRFFEAVRNGTVAAAESSFAWASSLPGPTIATGNVTFYPKVNSLVVDADVFERLDEKQREILEEAAARTQAWAIDAMPTDAEAAKVFCEAGGAVVLASNSDVAALERAVAPVYAELERDPETRRFIEAIRALEEEVAVSDTPAACGDRGTTAEEQPTQATTFPEGVYRTELSLDYLVRHGIETGEAHSNEGIQTLTFDDGRWTHETSANATNPPICEGSYTVEGRRVVVTFDTTEDRCGIAGEVLFSAEWRLAGGELRFTNIRSTIAEDAFAKVVWGRPWRKIG